jgi:2-amino-4-hydroxy-6-hydroxymethyldihydropteridine diphosphokinase
MISQVPTSAFIGLGSNVHDPLVHLQQAQRLLLELPGISLLKSSSVFRTEPQDMRDQQWFLNQVIQVQCTGQWSPKKLLVATQDIEISMGRQTKNTKGPRVIDLDILSFGSVVCRKPGLILPHPRMHGRAFVLVPLLEIAPEFVLPGGEPCGHYLQKIDYHIEKNCIFQKQN